VFFEAGHLQPMEMPGIHHVMARTIKDIFPRLQNHEGFQVKRKLDGIPMPTY